MPKPDPDALSEALRANLRRRKAQGRKAQARKSKLSQQVIKDEDQALKASRPASKPPGSS